MFGDRIGLFPGLLRPGIAALVMLLRAGFLRAMESLSRDMPPLRAEFRDTRGAEGERVVIE